MEPLELPCPTAADLTMSFEQSIIAPREARCLVWPWKSAILVAELCRRVWDITRPVGEGANAQTVANPPVPHRQIGFRWQHSRGSGCRQAVHREVPGWQRNAGLSGSIPLWSATTDQKSPYLVHAAPKKRVHLELIRKLNGQVATSPDRGPQRAILCLLWCGPPVLETSSPPGGPCGPGGPQDSRPGGRRYLFADKFLLSAILSLNLWGYEPTKFPFSSGHNPTDFAYMKLSAMDYVKMICAPAAFS